MPEITRDLPGSPRVLEEIALYLVIAYGIAWLLWIPLIKLTPAKNSSPLTASLLVWLPWALWHGPLDYFRPTPMSLTFWLLLRVVMLIPLTIILTWFYNRSGRSIQATVMFHASMNATPILFPYSQPAMALLFVWAAWTVISDNMWRRMPAALSSAQTEPAVPA